MQSLDEIFLAARDLAEPDQRAAYLSQACGSDMALRVQVEAMLRDAGAAHAFFLESDHRPAQPGPLAISERPGDRIGHYKLLEKLGEGGCGVVYLAEQEQPVRRQVALKIIKLGMDTNSVIARFEAERQALALMDHPHIAKVFDAGATETPLSHQMGEGSGVRAGRPFFVMELVRGPKITEYCEQQNLSTAQRLDLFVQVCQAIQHAHQKGIIHRDIKPSNVLVTTIDGKAVPKVIDFGIAKATTGQPLTDRTIQTALEQFIGTPAYMSPEQAEISSVDIDTRSDIYSLGVLLYELLTGQPPFDSKALLEAGFDAMRRTIREQEPPTPSARLTQELVAADVRRSKPDEGDHQTSSADSHRRLQGLVNQVRGDLDWIVMKCLEKDRARRYETANGLAQDIQRHLGNEPVVARPPSGLYRLQKAVRRNKVVFAASSAVLLALVLGLGLSTWLFLRERASRREQERLRLAAQSEAAMSQEVDQVLKDMLGSVGPSVAKGRDTALLRDILDKTADRLINQLTNQPHVQLQLGDTLANTYHDLGFYKQMVDVAQQSLRIARAQSPPDNPHVAWALKLIGDGMDHLGDPQQAETFTRQAVEMYRKHLGPDHFRVAYSLNDLANILRSEGKLSEAEIASREAVRINRKALGNQNSATSATLNNLSGILREEGSLGEAEAAAREALAIDSRHSPSENPAVATALVTLANVLFDEGKYSNAESLLREALALQRKLLPSEHPDTATCLISLAGTLTTQGKVGEAEAAYREGLAMLRTLFGSQDRRVEPTVIALANLLFSQGRLGEAETLFRDALATQRERLGNDHPDVATSLNTLGVVLTRQSKWAEAEPSLREALAIRRTHLGNDHPYTGVSLNSLALALQPQGKLAEAEILLREAVELFRKASADKPQAQTLNLAIVLHHLADVLGQEQSLDQANTLAEEAVTLFQKNLDWPPQEHAHALQVLATVCNTSGDLPGAERALKQQVQLMHARMPTADLDLAGAQAQLASTLLSQGKSGEAEAPARESLAIREKKAPDDWRTFSTRSLLGASLLGQQRYAEAEPLLLSGYEGMNQRQTSIPQPGKPRLKEALKRLAQLYTATGRPEEAAAWRKRLTEFEEDQTHSSTAIPALETPQP